jgi:hypothetical protein
VTFSLALLSSGVASAQSTTASSHPRTPWGDPDLQGYYTNKYEYGTPFEKPAAFAGRRVDELSAQELADLAKKRQQEALDRAPFLGGDPEGKIGNSAEFRDIHEVKKGSRPWFVIDPADGKIPPVLPEARARVRNAGTGGSFGSGPFNGPEDFSLWERCITRGLPGSMLPGVYGNSYQIVQAPGVVVIRYEMVHETRVIPLDPSTLRQAQGRPEPSRGTTSPGSPRAESRGDGRANLGKALRFDTGSARGHWEGDTLVVETTNFKQRSAYRNANAETLRLVERFQRTSTDRVEWSVTVDDPSTWARPWTFSMPLTRNEDEAIELYECHEGNHAIFNILSAARAAERDKASSESR